MVLAVTLTVNPLKKSNSVCVSVYSFQCRVLHFTDFVLHSVSESNSIAGTLPFEMRSIQSLEELLLERGAMTVSE